MRSSETILIAEFKMPYRFSNLQVALRLLKEEDDFI